MSKRAFILGGTGFIGTAVARRFVRAGWNVVVASRGERPVSPDLEELGVRVERVDRTNTGELEKALDDGADALVDIVAYTRADAEQLVAASGNVGTIVAISTGAVYVDASGRHLWTPYGAEAVAEIPDSISEDQRTVAPDDETYPGQKAAMEETLLNLESTAATVVRAPAVYGPGDSTSREWYFVKRALDGRQRIGLHDRGKNVYQCIFVENLAEVIVLAADKPGSRVVNAGDERPLTVLDRSRLIAAALDHDWAELLLPGPPPTGRGPGDATAHPWSVAEPFVFDLTRARRELGYKPPITNERAVELTCEWLVDVTRNREWTDVLGPPPEVWETESLLFDYASEDIYFKSWLSP